LPTALEAEEETALQARRGMKSGVEGVTVKGEEADRAAWLQIYSPVLGPCLEA